MKFCDGLLKRLRVHLPDGPLIKILACCRIVVLLCGGCHRAVSRLLNDKESPSRVDIDQTNAINLGKS